MIYIIYYFVASIQLAKQAVMPDGLKRGGLVTFGPPLIKDQLYTILSKILKFKVCDYYIKCCVMWTLNMH